MERDGFEVQEVTEEQRARFTEAARAFGVGIMSDLLMYARSVRADGDSGVSIAYGGVQVDANAEAGTVTLYHGDQGPYEIPMHVAEDITTVLITAEQ